MNLPPVNVPLVADIGDYRRNLRQAAGDLRSFEREADRSTSSIAGFFAGGLGAGAGLAVFSAGINAAKDGLLALTAAAAGQVGTGIKLAAEYEMTSAAFTTLLGSADRAKGMLEDLSSFANRTPFALPGLAAATQSLLSADVAAEQIIPTLRTLGDLALGDEQKFKDLVTIYGKGLGGQITNEDLAQIGERGIGIYAELGRQLGKSKTEVREMASQSKISIGDVQRAFIALTSEGGKFFGGMERGSQTLTGKLSSLEDAWDTMLREVGESLAGNLNFKGLVDGASEAIGEVKALVLPAVDAVVGKVAELGRELNERFNFRETAKDLLLITTMIAGEGVDALKALSVELGTAEGGAHALGNVLVDTFERIALVIAGATDMVEGFTYQLAQLNKAGGDVGAWLHKGLPAASPAGAVGAWFAEQSQASADFMAAVEQRPHSRVQDVEAAFGRFRQRVSLARSDSSMGSSFGGDSSMGSSFGPSQDVILPEAPDDTKYRERLAKDAAKGVESIRKAVKEQWDAGVKDWQKTMDEGRRVFEATRTPVEQLQAERGRLAYPEPTEEQLRQLRAARPPEIIPADYDPERHWNEGGCNCA